PPASGATREALGRVQEVYAELLLEMRERSPRHATLVSPVTATWRDVGRRLGADAALINYLVSDSGSLAFVVARDTVAVVDLGVERRTLDRLVEFARGTLLTPRTEGVSSIPADSLWRGPLRQLHQYLIAPLEETGLLAGKTRLILVPHAELHYLPFAALLGGSGRGQFLIERYEVAVTPSASVWLALGDRPTGRVPSGTLALAPRPDVLPASRREVAAGGRLGGADVPAGDDWVGLTRAFLHAGAANVVATLWPVEDWATAALMEEFYRAYVSGADPAHALAEAQRALLAAPTTSQPFYWAGFVITEAGDGKGVVR